MNKSDLVTTRDLLPGDINFIFSTWLLGIYYGDTIFKEMKKDIFMDHYHKLIETILNAPSTLIRIACLKDDQDVILGYAVMNKNKQTAYFTFVKSAWRKIGLAKMLLGPDVKTVTMLTKLGLGIIKRKGLEFNPFAI